MRIFLSSVRKGLERERDALPALIMALGHVPVRFEDFGAQDVPSRQACLDAVANSDAYLLLLGPHYGYRFPETGQSATHDEWRAAEVAGIHRFAFRKNGIPFDDDQERFAQEVGNYASGRFYKGFATAEELQTAVVETIRQLEATPTTLAFEPVQETPTAAWIEPEGGSNARRARLEVHVIPVGGQTITDRVFNQAAQRLPIQLRSEGLVSQFEGLKQSLQDEFVTVSRSADEQSRGWRDVTPARFDGVRISKSGQVSVLFTLPSDMMGSLFDSDVAVRDIARALRLVSRLDYIPTERCAIAVGLTTGQMVTVGSATNTSRSSASLGSRDEPVRVLPDETIPTVSLDGGAHELAELHAQALLRALRQ